MKARFLKFNALEMLRTNVEKNLENYRSGDFSEIEINSSNWLSVDFEVDEKKFLELKSPVGQKLFDIENCQIVHQSLQGLTPYKARDERLWAYLTHTSLLEHTRKRWPIPDEDNEAIKHIQKHFFGKDKRSIERDNAASRLWWMAHLCSRVQGMTLLESLEVFLHMSDVRANVIERPTTAQSIPVFTALIHKLAKSYKGQQALFERETFRRLMREINSAGGARLLECMEAPQVDALLDGIIKNRLQLTAV